VAARCTLQPLTAELHAVEEQRQTAEQPEQDHG